MEKNLLPGEKVPARADEGWEKALFTGPQPSSATVSPLKEDECNFSMMDSATSLFGSALNDRVGGMLVRVKVFGLEKPTERKSVAMSIDFLMMLCALVRNDAECIG